MRFRRFVWAFAVASLLGCGGGGGASVANAWTIIVFMNAANNLDDFGPLNMNQMEAGLSGGGVRIVVQWKRISQWARIEPWVGTRRYLVSPDPNVNKVNSQLLQSLPDDTDMGDWQTLRDFVLWAKATYPADHYAVVIWNHGNGILRTPEGGITRNVSYDDGTGHSIFVWQLTQALNVGGLDMVVFDSSLMQMVETAWQIRNQAAYCVGSEESPPGAGYPYDRVVSRLCANPAMSPASFGGVWVAETLAAYGGQGGIAQSAVETSKLQPLVDAMNTLGGVLSTRRTGFETQLALAGAAPTYKNPKYKDLGNLAGRFAQFTADTAIGSASHSVTTALAAAVVAEGHSTAAYSPDESFSTGLSLYYPNGGGYSAQYEMHDIAAAAPLWTTWIKSAP